MSIKIVMKSGKDSHERTFTDLALAKEEFSKLKKLNLTFEAELWHNDVLIRWLNHSITQEKGGQYRS